MNVYIVISENESCECCGVVETEILTTVGSSEEANAFIAGYETSRKKASLNFWQGYHKGLLYERFTEEKIKNIIGEGRYSVKEFTITG